MFTHQLIRGYKDTSLVAIQGTESVMADSEVNFDGSIAGLGTDVEVDWAITRANLKALLLFCDKEVTVETNSSSAPTDTIVLKPNIGKVWSLAGDGLTNCPFSADVTKLFITNAGADAANLKVRALVDQTP